MATCKQCLYELEYCICRQTKWLWYFGRLNRRIKELEQEVERLQTERDRAEELLEQYPSGAEVERLREALEKCGRHLSDCNTQYFEEGEIHEECTCGLEQALKGEG